jgi:hypothetical protein
MGSIVGYLAWVPFGAQRAGFPYLNGLQRSDDCAYANKAAIAEKAIAENLLFCPA